MGFESVCLEDGPLTRANYRVKVLRHEELEGELAEPWMGGIRGVDQPPEPEDNQEELFPDDDGITEDEDFLADI